MKAHCNPAVSVEKMKEFKRGDKIHFHGKDSKFNGFFLHYIEKLPMYYQGNLSDRTTNKRCVVQQNQTGILLIKPNPTEDNRGWK